MTECAHEWLNFDMKLYGEDYIGEKCRHCGSWRTGYVPIAQNKNIHIEKRASTYSSAKPRRRSPRI